MAYMKSEDLQAFRALARTLYFSNDTIKHFLENATAGQITAVGDMIKFELSVRDARKIGSRAECWCKGPLPWP